MSASWIRLTHAPLRRTAHAVEQMVPGGTDRPEPGRVDLDDIEASRDRLRSSGDATVARMMRALDALEAALRAANAPGALYLDPAESALPSDLRSAAIEIDFSFGDRDGRVSPADLRAARQRYRSVRGPVGWNRLLTTDEVERRLHPRRALQSSEGPRLRPGDWANGAEQPVRRLAAMSERLDDETLARTYADIAARLVTVVEERADVELKVVFRGALDAVAWEINRRRSVRPTLSDLARIGCEDPEVKAILHSPMEMARRLRSELLLDPQFPD